MRFSMLVALVALLHCKPATGNDILVVGDSYASGIVATDAFNTFLASRGIDAVAHGDFITAKGGRTAAELVATTAEMRHIVNQITGNTDIRFVHLMLGGNDLMGMMLDPSFPSWTRAQRDAAYQNIIGDVQTVTGNMLAARPDLRVILAGYEYPDIARLEASSGFRFSIAQVEVNDELIRFSLAVRTWAIETQMRVDWVQNLGVLQHATNAAVPAPGGAHGYAPFPAGDPYGSMPVAYQLLDGLGNPDGLHPNAAGHQLLVANAWDHFYDELWVDVAAP